MTLDQYRLKVPLVPYRILWSLTRSYTSVQDPLDPHETFSPRKDHNIYLIDQLNCTYNFLYKIGPTA